MQVRPSPSPARSQATVFPLSGKIIWICEDDPFIPDECLASGMTNYDGSFSIEWTAMVDIVETDFDIYAEFDGGQSVCK